MNLFRSEGLITFLNEQPVHPATVANEHRMVIISILSTVTAGVVLFLATVAISGGISTTLIKSYVLPLFMSAFTLSIYAVFLFARQKGKLPIVADDHPKEETGTASK